MAFSDIRYNISTYAQLWCQYEQPMTSQNVLTSWLNMPQKALHFHLVQLWLCTTDDIS